MSPSAEVYDNIADQIASQGWAVVPQFLPLQQLRALAAEAHANRAAGRFHPAGVGSGRAFALRREVRGDHIAWLDLPGTSDVQRSTLAQFEQLRLVANRELQLGLFDFECHFALYPPGACYRRHLDRFAGDWRRALSTVLYLNVEWGDEDGGELRLYLADGTHIDVLPRGGTLATFLSDRIEHEVLPGRRDRLSLAGWFRRRT
jgi:SM-20-related protein